MCNLTGLAPPKDIAMYGGLWEEGREIDRKVVGRDQSACSAQAIGCRAARHGEVRNYSTHVLIRSCLLIRTDINSTPENAAGPTLRLLGC